MKIKVRPNKKAYLSRLIQDYQKEVKQERGITLIALIVMVIILVILVAIVINGVTGDEGILVSTETAAESYIIEQYKEQIQQLAQSIIVKDSILGEVTTVTSMAEDMEEEDWIKSAEPNESTKDIIVTTTDGYVYQVYYDNETGELNVEYIGVGVGVGDGSSIPTIIASYDKDTSTINAEAYCDDGIAKIELIYRGEVVQEESSSLTANFKVSETGWYQVKATSSKGISRSTWVRVTSETITAPTIVVTSSGEQENGWYGKDNVKVVVTISIESGTADGIYYKTNVNDQYIYESGTSAIYTIDTAGRRVIYAYAGDSDNENVSDIVNLEIKYDNDLPTVGTPEVSPEASGIDWYTTNVTISLPNMTDDTSGVAGYYYWKTGDEANKTYVSGTSTTITVASEGITEIGFQVKDNAGNLSGGTTSLTVKKDSVAPKAFTPEITNKTTTGFTIIAGTTDDTTYTNDVSGMSYYEIYINEELVQTINVTDESNTNISYTVEGLTVNTIYRVYIRAYDKAGNMRESSNMTAVTEETAGSTEDTAGLTSEELATKIGDYVDYTPISSSYRVTSTYNGYGTISNSTDTSLKWRILYGDSDKLTLIADSTAHSGFYLTGVRGVNNAVLLLNEACETMYSNSSLGATGRSLNRDDIERVSDYDPYTYTNEYSSTGYYGGTKEYSGVYGHYPTVFLQSLGLSEQRSYYTTSSASSGSITLTQTYYTYTISKTYMDLIYVELLNYEAGGTATTLSAYWLATRCVDFGNLSASYRVCYVGSGAVTAIGMIGSANSSSTNTYGYAIRPVVEIDLSKVTIGATGIGTRTTPYSIEAK